MKIEEHIYNEITFLIERPNGLELNDSIRIGFRKDGIPYGAEFNKVAKSKIFGEIDLTEMSNRELVLMCIANVLYKEHLK